MARLRASWRTNLPVDQQPRNPQSESIARSPYERLFSPGALQAPRESGPAQGADEPAEPPHPRTAKRPAPPKLSSASKPKSEQKPAQLTTQPAAAAVPASAFASAAPGPQDGSTASSRAKAPEPDRLYTCDIEASGKDLRGYARGLFISECLSKGTPGSMRSWIRRATDCISSRCGIVSK